MKDSEVRKTYLIYKELGETPLEALERLRAHLGIPERVPMTYAGRLDPAAEGVLIILAGEECKNKLAYTGLPKTYVAEILLGVSTDTFDLLGLPAFSGAGIEMTVQKTGELYVAAEEWIRSQIGARVQSYPPYSSKTVAGVQLHARAKKGEITELPNHVVTLRSYAELSVRPKKRADILARARMLSEKVSGDFRQKAIAEAWAGLADALPADLAVLKVTIEVGSGFYVRQLAQDLGRSLGTGACLYSLVRTKINDRYVL